MTNSTTAIAIAISLMMPAAFTAVHAQETAQKPQQLEHASTVRENVKNDLSDWREAGFDDDSYRQLSYDVYGAEYQRRYAKYLELKQLRAQTSTQVK